jgi:DNA-binding transcriptional ArsR family regulator
LVLRWSPDVTEVLDDILVALADPTRRAIIDRLARRPMRSGELAEVLGSSPSAMSRHLQLLRRHGLVEEQHELADARVRMYSLAEEPLRELSTWLDETRRFWSEQLVAFRNHVERSTR